MKIRSIVFAWLLSLGLLTTLAGASWVDVLLSSDAGGQAIPITGFTVFPVISALLLVQGSALLVSLLTPILVSRVIAAALIPIQLWHFVTVVMQYQAASAIAVSSEIGKVTGIVGDGQLQLIASSSESLWVFGYLFALVVNLALLVLRTLVRQGPKTQSSDVDQSDDPTTLWESQK